MEATNWIPYIFGAFTLAGVLYFLYSIFFGGATGDAGMDASGDAGEFGLTIIAAFCAAFGAVGLAGTLSGWGWPLTLGAAVVFGLVIGRGAMSLLRYVARQQSTSVTTIERLIGSSARITIDTPAGKTGEAIVDDAHVSKYPVKEINEAALNRGDHVEIVEIRSGTLYVKKKRMG